MLYFFPVLATYLVSLVDAGACPRPSTRFGRPSRRQQELDLGMNILRASAVAGSRRDGVALGCAT
jgi:hypothetical protein